MENKRQHKILTVIVLSFLVVILFLGEQRFHHRLRINVFSNNNIKELKKYTYKGELADGVSCIIPREWEVRNIKLDNKRNEGLLQYDNFQSSENGIYGYVKIWTDNIKLEDLLHNDMEVCNMQGDIEDYQQEDIKFDKFKGYKVTYNMKTVHGDDFRVQEYFIKGKNKCIKFNFTKEEKVFRESDDRIFNTIVETVEVNNI